MSSGLVQFDEPVERYWMHEVNVTLRRADKLATEDLAWAVLARAHVVHLASTLPGGEPVLRVLHGVVLDGAVWFHGAPKGEKNEAIGRPAVISAHEVVAEIESTFTDPERACPATTYYRSAMLHGTIEQVDGLPERARALQALMERYQPAGGHAPIRHDDPRYAAQVRGIRILRVRPDQIVGKVALGQMKPPDHRRKVIEGLWARGGHGDAAAIEAMLDVAPLDPVPSFLAGPHGTRLVVAPGTPHLPAVVGLLRVQYWNRGVSDEVIAAAHVGSPAWVVATVDGRVIASARAIGDGRKTGYVADVVVEEGWRGRGVGQAVVQTLLAHPGLRHTQRVDLMTRDAGEFYAGLGFSRVDGREVWRIVRATAG